MDDDTRDEIRQNVKRLLRDEWHLLGQLVVVAMLWTFVLQTWAPAPSPMGVRSPSVQHLLERISGLLAVIAVTLFFVMVNQHRSGQDE